MLMDILFWFGLLLIVFYIFQNNQQTLFLYFYARFFPSRLNKLRNKTCWILGCSSGIGEKLAYQLAQLHCKLILSATNAEKLKEVKLKCIELAKGSLQEDDVLICPFDLGDLENHAKQVKEVFNKFYKLDILFANAARLRLNPFTKLTYDDWQYIHHVNFLAPLNLIRLVMAQWDERKVGGKIFFTSSVAASCPYPLYSCYATAKSAMQHALDHISVENYSRGIECYYASPGPVRTEIFSKSDLFPLIFDTWIAMEADTCANLMLHSLVNRLRNPIIASDYKIHILSYFGAHFQSLTQSVAKQMYSNPETIEKELSIYNSVK